MIKKLFRNIFFGIASALYSLIPPLYDIFYKLSSAKIFETETIETFSRNIYVIVSACMLFALGIRLLSAIVNPDNFNDNKKGAKRTFLNCFIAIILIAIVPIGFEKAYQIQNDLIGSEDPEDKSGGNSIIAVLFLGKTVGNNDSIGEILAKESFKAFCYVKNESEVSPEVYDAWKDLSDDFSEDSMDNLGDVINYKSGGKWEVEFHILLSPAFGGYMVYQMVLMCLDVATRSIRLAILQIMAPLVICGFIFSGTEILQRWFKDVISTYIIVFAKIVALIFTVFGVQNIDSIFTNNSFSDLNFIASGFVKAAIIIGLLTVVKQLPSIINNIFGTNIQEQGRIRDRLGNMAGIGTMAQNAWDSITKPLSHPVKTAAAVASGIGGAAAHIAAASKRGAEIRDKMKEENKSRFKGELAKWASFGGGLLTAGGAAIRAAKSGYKNTNLSGIGEQARRYYDTHPENSTLGGRIANQARGIIGLSSTAEREMELWEKNNDDYTYVDPTTGQAIKFGTLEQMNRRKQQSIANIRENKEKNRLIDEKINSNNNNIINPADKISERCDKKNLEETSKIKIMAGENRDGKVWYTSSDGSRKYIETFGEKNLHEYQEFIENLKKDAPKKENYTTRYFDEAGYEAAKNVAMLHNQPAPDKDSFYKTKFDEAAYNKDFFNFTAAAAALDADFKQKKENDARDKYIVGVQTGSINDNSITNAMEIIANSDSSFTRHSSDGLFHFSTVIYDSSTGQIIEDANYKGVDNISKAKKGENDDLGLEKNNNEKLMDPDQTILSQIEQAEAEHKRAKEQYEASQKNVRLEANKKAEEARRGKSDKGNS